MSAFHKKANERKNEWRKEGFPDQKQDKGIRNGQK
jgi:hypothetical protein